MRLGCVISPDGRIAAKIRRESLFLKGLGSRTIRKELIVVLGSTGYSLPEIKQWSLRFKAGDI
jgi:hypothetical protein